MTHSCSVGGLAPDRALASFVLYGGKHDGSGFRLVCERFGVLGGDIGNHLQGDQRLGLCHHLADPDPPAGGGHHLAVAKDSSTLEKEPRRIIKVK